MHKILQIEPFNITVYVYHYYHNSEKQHPQRKVFQLSTLIIRNINEFIL